MKLDSLAFKSLFNEELHTLANMFKNHGYDLRIVGGAVRDLLINKQPKDVDFATNATPDEMKNLFKTDGVRFINERGEKHGTVTFRINDKINYEVTTLRVDRVTDGRYAEVEFTQDWKVDASRRDLTINSMFLGLDGTLYDNFNGYSDLMKRKVVFVGNVRKRIKEDYLRILRYFRFYGQISKVRINYDDDTIKAIKDHVQGIGKISGERIWMELSLILSNEFWGEQLEQILKCGLGPYMGLPQNSNVECFAKFYKSVKNKTHFYSITKLIPLLRTENEFLNLCARLKLSSFDRDMGLFIIKFREKTITLQWCKYNTVMLQQKTKLSNIQFRIKELLKYKQAATILREYSNWNVPKFPVNGKMLQDQGVPMNQNTSNIMNKLKEYWIIHDCDVSSQEILEQLHTRSNEEGWGDKNNRNLV